MKRTSSARSLIARAWHPAASDMGCMIESPDWKLKGSLAVIGWIGV